MKGKFRDFQKYALLSAAILTGLSPLTSCTTTWQKTGTRYKPTGIEREVTISSYTVKELEKKFDITIPAASYFQVSETLTESEFDKRTVITEKKLREVNVEQRTVGNVDYFLSSSLICGGSFAIVVPLLLNMDGEATEEKQIIGGALGFVSGVGLAMLLSGETETREIATGRTKTESGNSRIENILVGENVIYQNRPAGGISVKIGAENSSRYLTTNSEGIITMNDALDFLESVNPRFFRNSYSGIVLENKISTFSLVRQMKPETRDLLMNDLIEAISQKKIIFSMETNEKSAQQNMTIENAHEGFYFTGRELSDEAIYRIVDRFVDEQINSSIKNLGISIKNILTRFPITNSNIVLESNSPSKSDLAGRYFTGELKEFAERNIHDYLIGTISRENLPDSFSFPIYTPSNIFIEVTNENYIFVSGQFEVRRNTNKTVYMVDVGDKVRLESSQNISGKIE